MMNIKSLKLLVVFVSSVTSQTGKNTSQSFAPSSFNSTSTTINSNTTSIPSTTINRNTTSIPSTTINSNTTSITATTQDSSASPNSSNCTCLLSDNNLYGVHAAVYSLLGLIIIISFGLNIVLLFALVIRKNKTNKSLSSDNNTQETEATVELRDYRQEDNLYEINQTEDNEHDTMYAVINKSQPPPLPPSYDIDHSTLGGHGPVYDVATDYEEEGDKRKVMKRPSQYEIPLSLHYPTSQTDTTS